MNYAKSAILLILAFLFFHSSIAQLKDSAVRFSHLPQANCKTIPKKIQETYGLRLPMRTLVIPVSLITYGVISQSSEDLREFDVNIKNIVRRDEDFRTTIDNYLQYAPGVSVYILNAAGIKGKNNFRDRTMIYLMSNLIMGITVQTIKNITKVQRPDGFGKNAFPSGHTATAFAGAEFLRQEYKDVSPWYGIAGYAVATTTGFLRMYNNRHWLSDVVAGAGFGILSTKIAYWIAPIVAKRFFHKKTVYRF